MRDKFGNEALILPEENEEEEWRPAPYYEDRYEISNFGHIRNKKTKKQRKLQYDNGGYPVVHLRRKINEDDENMTICCVYIHREVCEAFNGPPTPEQNICDHIDRCIENNYYKNLHWTDYIGNRANHKPTPKSYKIKKKSTPIVFLSLDDGHLLQRFDNTLQAHEILGISIQQIQANLRGIRKPFKDGYFRTEADYRASLDESKKF